jgi:prepilin-type N-terminal cleavage/methylation domain-containing protein
MIRLTPHGSAFRQTSGTQMKNVHTRRGFTLIEMVVFIAIVGVLIGLLMPAMGRVREVAQQNACRNNLKQIGLALQNYHSAHKSFPSAFLFTPSHEPPKFQGMKTSPGWGWGTLLLPFLEQTRFTP